MSEGGAKRRSAINITALRWALPRRTVPCRAVSNTCNTTLVHELVAARGVLTEAFEKNPNSEEVWLAGAKLELENGETERARVLLERAREKVDGPKVWMKSALLERECGKWRESLKLLEEGARRFPKFEKLYMMGGQIWAERGGEGVANARKWFQKGLAASDNKCVELWVLAARLEEGEGGGGGSKARR